MFELQLVQVFFILSPSILILLYYIFYLLSIVFDKKYLFFQINFYKVRYYLIFCSSVCFCIFFKFVPQLFLQGHRLAYDFKLRICFLSSTTFRFWSPFFCTSRFHNFLSPPLL
nr:MAG TPA: hypothetical protein [Caudoviricetes sp.]